MWASVEETSLSSLLLGLTALCRDRMAYSHAPLQNANNIRLLRLGSDCCSTPLKAHLASYRLGDHCSYDALSYAWGEPDLTESLLVNDQEFKISKNLHTILLHLRYPDRIRTLWID